MLYSISCHKGGRAGRVCRATAAGEVRARAVLQARSQPTALNPEPYL